MIIDIYRSSLSIRNYQPASLKKNIQLASLFMLAVGDVKRINIQTIEKYLIDLKETGRSIKTVINHRSAIKVFCDFLMFRGIIKDNPVLRIPSMKMPDEISVYLCDAERELAYQVARRAGMVCEVTLALNTGLRLTELRMLQWRDVDLTRKQLIVRKSKSKKPRTVPLNQLALQSLDRQFGQYGHLVYVFPGGEAGGHVKGDWTQPTARGTSWWHKRSIRVLQRELPTLHDMPPGRTGRGWHIFRHTFATRAIKAGVDVVTLRDWLGHRKIETTMRYIHVARHYDPAIELV